VNHKGFSDFGLAASIGISTSFIAILVFFPAVVFIFDQYKPLNIKTRKVKFLSTFHAFVSAKSLQTAVVFLIITVAALASTNYVNMEYDFNKLSFPGKYDPDSINTKYVNAVRKEKNDFMSTGLPSFILTKSKEETEDVSHALDKIKKDNSNSIEFKDYISLYSFIPEDQEAKLSIIKSIRRIIERKINLFDDKTVERYRTEFEPYLNVDSTVKEEKLPLWIKDMLSLKDGSCDKFIILGLGGNKSDIDDVIKIEKEYGIIKGSTNYYSVLGSYMLLSEIKLAIDRHVPMAVMFSFLAVFLVLLILFRSFPDALTVFMPLSAGILYMILIAVIFDIKFNIFNMVIVPTVIGTGIDSAIHIFYRYKVDRNISMTNNLKNTGSAVFFSSLTTLVGFGSVVFASHKGLQSIGIMASIGIITVTTVNLLFFPVLIDLNEKIKLKPKSFYSEFFLNPV
jgi:predicted RND superfamily exporter protein